MGKRKHYLTNQECFEKVARHLLRQDKKSLTADKMACAYRGKGKLKCAIGCLIPASLYSHDFEGKKVYSLLEVDVDFPFKKVKPWLLDALQIIHDSYSSKYWRDHLIKLADDYGLKWPSRL